MVKIVWLHKYLNIDYILFLQSIEYNNIYIITQLMSSKGKFSNYYSIGQQRAILFIFMSLVTTVAYFRYFVYKSQKRYLLFKMSRAANILILFSNIIFFMQIYQPYGNIYIKILQVLFGIVNLLIFLLQQISQILQQTYFERYRRITELILILVANKLLVELYLPIIVYLLMQETCYLIGWKIRPFYRWIYYPHILAAAIYLPLFNILLHDQEKDLISSLFNMNASLYIGLYLFVIYELNIQCQRDQIRKRKMLLLLSLRKYIDFFEILELCRKCYHPGSNSILIKSDDKRYHSPKCMPCTQIIEPQNEEPQILYRQA